MDAAAICSRNCVMMSPSVCVCATTPLNERPAIRPTRRRREYIFMMLATALISHDCAAKTYCPAMRFVSEENTFQWMLRTAAFRGPGTAAVGRVNDRSFRADGPAFLCVDKLHVKQIDLDAGFLPLPRAPAVCRAKHAATAADGPTEPI